MSATPKVWAKPTSRGEARKRHEWRKALAHTHLVRSRKSPDVLVTVHCTKATCAVA